MNRERLRSILNKNNSSGKEKDGKNMDGACEKGRGLLAIHPAETPCLCSWGFINKVKRPKILRMFEFRAALALPRLPRLPPAAKLQGRTEIH